MGNEAKKGGAIYIDESQIVLDGDTVLVRNSAIHGGALFITKSKFIIEIDSQIVVNANSAAQNGGGAYLTASELNIRGESLYFTRNRASKNGGGIHAANSSITIEGAINFVSNKAENGGGISLETNATLHGLSAGNDLINLVTNRASCYGGALFVDDTTNSGLCTTVTIPNTIPSSECFFKSVFINTSDNSASKSGSNLFGGLLDRCMVHSGIFKEKETYKAGIMSFLDVSNTDLDSISSQPVRLCFCRDSKPDCNYYPQPIQVNREKSFSVEVIAYDQAHHPVSARIQCNHNLSAGGLGEGHTIQKIDNKCTLLNYIVFTTNSYARLTFSAVQDPCNNISEVSKRNIVINIICSCPIGFHTVVNNGASCDCTCDPMLQLSKQIECNQTTKSIIRIENCWISYINHTWPNSSGFIIYPHCPFDYCYTPDKHVSINLTLPNGSDAQCDSHRMGTLCGTCKPGLSVSLGSSKCLSCPTYWPGLLVTITIVFIISGIGLVAFLLALNLTVAIGTLNAIIFYANIVAANKSAFFPTQMNFQIPFVLISWLNFDLGFDVCFFNGMDTYIKMWLHLAFPAYIIILVIMIIKLSYYFGVFGRLIGKKDPVATLATLVLLSYTKFLQTIITAFSSAIITYPDGSKSTLWLPDATVEYGTNKHAVLLFIAILILVVGFIYTLLLFLWQWFLYFPRKRVKWIRSQKLSSFVEIYFVPYKPKHRYWTGLLLLVRVSVYLVSAFNPSGDPRVTLLATNFIVTTLLLYIATFGIRIYKNHRINTMEMLTYFNVIALCNFTWYTIDSDMNQTVITNISVVITIIQFLAIIVYHVYKHMNHKLFSTIHGSAVYGKIKETFIRKQPKRAIHKTPPTDEDIHRFHELLDFIDRPANTNDYKIPQVQPKPVEPTRSVVELPQPQLSPAATPPPPVEAIEEGLEPELTEQQTSKPEGTHAETKEIEIYTNKQSYSDTECNASGHNRETEMKHNIIRKRNSIPKPSSNLQVCNIPLLRSDNMNQSTQEVSSFPEDNVDCQCIVVEAEVHNY